MYEVRATKLEEPAGNVVGLASIVVDDKFAFNSIKVVKSNDDEKGLFVSMPSYKNKAGEYVDFFHPVTKEMYDAVTEAVLLAYNSGQKTTIGSKKTNITTYVEAHDYENSKGKVTLMCDKEFVCSTIQIRKDGRSEDGKLFIAMPSYKSKDGTYKDYCNPVSKEFYEEFNKDVLDKHSISASKNAEKHSVGVKVSEEKAAPSASKTSSSPSR